MFIFTLIDLLGQLKQQNEASWNLYGARYAFKIIDDISLTTIVALSICGIHMWLIKFTLILGEFNQL